MCGDERGVGGDDGRVCGEVRGVWEKGRRRVGVGVGRGCV